MWNKPTKKQLSVVPKLRSQDGEHTRECIVYLHFFRGQCDWYITEFDGKDTFFGFAILFPEQGLSEWGYISYKELLNLDLGGFEADCNKFWKPTKVKDIQKIVEEGGCF